MQFLLMTEEKYLVDNDKLILKCMSKGKGTEEPKQSEMKL